MRETDDRPLPPAPRSRDTRLSMHGRVHPHATRATLPHPPRSHHRRRDQPTAARYRHPARARRSRSPSKPNSRPRAQRGRPSSPPAHTSNVPATTPTSPAAATSQSILTTDSSPTRSRPTGTMRWRALQAAQDDYERADRRRPRRARPRSTRPGSAELAADFPKLWSDPATPARERKRIARLLIEDVTP